MQNLGIMVNYRCNACCPHCLYASSPQWSDAYMQAQTAEKVARQLREYGVRSVHIGGGEPFLHFEGLRMVLEKLAQADIAIDYIETNAFWCARREDAVEKIRRVKQLGGNTLMASCDPFHVQFVPPQRVVNFIAWCRECGMDFFIWQERYLNRLLRMHMDLSHPLNETQVCSVFGASYRTDVAAEYGLAFNGRALRLLQECCRKRPAQEVAGMCNAHTLRTMRSGHVDLYGRFLPEHCLGFGVALDWALEGGTPGRYPLLDILRREGLQGLYSFCLQKGFQPDPQGYVSSCALCMQLKRFLLPLGYDEIYPEPYFENV